MNMNQTPRAVDKLQTVLMAFGPVGFVTELTDLVSNYTYLVNAVTNGLGNTERPDDEDPAAVLEALRRFVEPSTNKLNDIAYFVHTFAELAEAAEDVVNEYRRARG
ncbi:hypothetical protein [uncultured Rikenella sp.]|uniref:hypothetical protein n=1 Tax=uncultured Rikenella sp. TaxID=368003 RepID=UPI002628D67A|nr:hypothetical protein [uncultured Rikenella sp.]